MSWMPGVLQLPCPDGHGTMAPVAGVVHDTIGTWPGDRDYVARNSLAHFTVGPDEGDWAQHAPITTILYHCNGANFKAFGIEFSAQEAGQPLTVWQAKAWADIRAWAVGQGIVDTYLDPESVAPASVNVNYSGFVGWISHLSVQTDDGSAQHIDYVQYADYQTPSPPIPVSPIEVPGDNVYSVVSGSTPNGPLFQVWFNPASGQQVKQVLGQGTAPLVSDALLIGTARAKTFDPATGAFSAFVIDQGHMDSIAVFKP